MVSPKEPQQDLQALVERMQHLKAEHTPLLTKIEADPGMSSDVRRALLDHLNQEEDELAAQIAVLSPGAPAKLRPAGRGSTAAPSEPRLRDPKSPAVAGRGLTVGSLRKDAARPGSLPGVAPHAPAKDASGASGSLRRGTVGSLRRR
jgi:hypothetical protein